MGANLKGLANTLKNKIYQAKKKGIDTSFIPRGYSKLSDTQKLNLINRLGQQINGDNYSYHGINSPTPKKRASKPKTTSRIPKSELQNILNELNYKRNQLGNIAAVNSYLCREDVGEYQEWVDYDMKKYGRISKETFDKLRKADLTVVKDEYGDYEVIPHEKIHEACKKRKVDKKLEESIIYTSEGLNNAMKEFAKVVRDWKKTHVDSQEEKVIAESNWDDDSFNTFIATLEG